MKNLGRDGKRILIRDVLEHFLGKEVSLFYGGEFAVAYLTRRGIDHAKGGNLSAEKASAISKYYELIRNAEYAFGSKHDEHSNTGKLLTGNVDWDYFVSVAMIDGEQGPILLTFRTIDRDVRTQIHAIATKNEIDFAHDSGQQNNALGDSPNYGSSSISGDNVPQPAPSVNTERSQRRENLTDRAVLEGVSNLLAETIDPQIHGETLTNLLTGIYGKTLALHEGERELLNIYLDRLEKLNDLQERRREQGRLYRRFMSDPNHNNRDRGEAAATKNRMVVRGQQIEGKNGENNLFSPFFLQFEVDVFHHRFAVTAVFAFVTAIGSLFKPVFGEAGVIEIDIPVLETGFCKFCYASHK